MTRIVDSAARHPAATPVASSVFSLEDLEIAVLHEGTIHSDGGVVFGNIPRPLWEKLLPPDSMNRVPLGLNQLLVRGSDFVLLVDCGIGRQLPKRLQEIYGITELNSWEKRLAPFGLTCDEVTHVLLTHLHYDHCGGATQEDTNAEEVLPTFPYARYFIQRGEWDAACHPNERTRPSYRFRNFLPLQDSGKIEFLEGNTSILGGVRVSITGGHTRFHQMVLIERGNRKVLFPGDVCPTPYHLNFTWHSAFDLFPLDTMNARKWLLRQTIGSEHLTIFLHDQFPRFHRIGGTFDTPQALECHDPA